MNKTPEQTARDNIDKMLERSGWVVVDKTAINWGLGPGLAVREYQTDAGPANYGPQTYRCDRSQKRNRRTSPERLRTSGGVLC
ncbi:MAG: hypothetical protein QY305_05425 [Candidatus Brocadiaceae baterium WH-1]|nr:MAG: hypothetical protein QY305_05425 [Candidatus Jettenia sp. AMX2]